MIQHRIATGNEASSFRSRPGRSRWPVVKLLRLVIAFNGALYQHVANRAMLSVG